MPEYTRIYGGNKQNLLLHYSTRVEINHVIQRANAREITEFTQKRHRNSILVQSRNPDSASRNENLGCLKSGQFHVADLPVVNLRIPSTFESYQKTKQDSKFYVNMWRKWCGLLVPMQRVQMGLSGGPINRSISCWLVGPFPSVFDLCANNCFTKGF